MDSEDKTDENLVKEADAGLRGQGAVTEMMRRLKNSIEKFNKNTTEYNRIMFELTLVLIVLAILQIIIPIFLDGRPWIAVFVEVLIFLIVIFGSRFILKKGSG